MRYVFTKADLDTCLCGLITGADNPDAEILHIRNHASRDMLYDPAICCIECGGSGQDSLNNFDHHLPGTTLPPACRQAWFRLGEQSNRELKRLVEYVCQVDEASSPMETVPFPSLSNLFSGMMIVVNDEKERFLKGIAILKTVLDAGIDPFNTMPRLTQWENYIQAKEKNMEKVLAARSNALFFRTVAGLKAGFMELTSFGGTGWLYSQGCDIAVLFNPEFGAPPVKKYTIASQTLPVEKLLPKLNRLEPGWGGRKNIIGSPRGGSKLQKQDVMEVVFSTNLNSP